MAYLLTQTMKFARRVVQYAILFSLLAFAYKPVNADIVKPALVEISVNTNGNYRVEIRASIEAMLTGINSRYKNTQDAPNAEAYDELRVLQAEQLEQAFEPFHRKFINEVKLKFDTQIVPLEITKIEIPEPGYTKVPRISLIVLEGQIDRSIKTLYWYYPERFADNAVRVRQVDEANEKWYWSQWQWLRKDQWSEPFSLEEVFTEQPISSVISTYLSAGFDHILPKGLDHILFILGIFLLSIKMRPLVWQVTMFTLAHSITLSLSMLNIINLPASIVEPLIALSIAYIGIENIFSQDHQIGSFAGEDGANLRGIVNSCRSQCVGPQRLSNRHFGIRIPAGLWRPIDSLPRHGSMNSKERIGITNRAIRAEHDRCTGIQKPAKGISPFPLFSHRPIDQIHV